MWSSLVGRVPWKMWARHGLFLEKASRASPGVLYSIVEKISRVPLDLGPRCSGLIE